MKITEANRQFLAILIEKIPIGLVVIDKNGVISLINPQAIEYLMIDESSHTLLDKPILSFLKSRKIKNRIISCLQNKTNKFKLIAIPLNSRYLNILCKQIEIGFIIQIQDNTEAILMRDQATQSLLLGQETERRRIAKEIHDGIGPTLSTIKLYVESLLRNRDNTHINPKLKLINDIISEVSLDIRQISHDLMPGSIIDFGLKTALQNLVNRLNGVSDISFKLSTELEDNFVTKELELNIFRIIQELLNNCLKHSKARSVSITLNIVKNDILIEVKDDGVGFESLKINEGIGIHNINTRVKSFRGSLEYDSNKEKGTLFKITIPLKRHLQ